MSEEIEPPATVDKPSPPLPSSNKRKRTRRACIQCRGRKQKCDGRQPTCSTCYMLAIPCNYEAASKRRGLPTGYVRSLELLWALVFAVVPNGRKIILDLMSNTDFAVDTTGKLMITGRLISGSDALRQLWLDSGVPAELERRLSKLEGDIDAQASPSTTTHRAPGSAGFTHLRTIPFASIPDLERETSHTPAIHPVNETRQSLSLLQTHQGVPAPPKKDPIILSRPPQNAHHLLDIYFTYTNSWLPLVEKHEMFEVLYSYPESPMANCPNTSLLWAILAHSSIQESRDSNPSISAEALEPYSQGNNMTPHQIFAVARKFVPSEEENINVINIRHAKSLLILSLCLVYRGNLSAAWRLIGSAVRIALVSCQHPLESHKNIPDTERSLTLLGCFVLDTLIAYRLGYPPHLRDMDIPHLAAIRETGPCEWEPWTPVNNQRSRSQGSWPPSRAISTFNHFVNVCRILNTIKWKPGEVSYGVPCTKHTDSLRQWADNLPPHCILNPGHEQLGPNNSVTPQLLNLQLAFRSVLIALREHHDGSSSELDQLLGGYSIAQLKSHYEEMFGVSFTPAIFSVYATVGGDSYHYEFGDQSVNPLPHDPLQPDQAQTVESIPNSSITCVQISMDDGSIVLDPSTSVTTSDPKRSFTQELLQDGLGGFPLPEHTQAAELSCLDGIEWNTLSPDFMLNLGFACPSPGDSHHIEPP